MHNTRSLETSFTPAHELIHGVNLALHEHVAPALTRPRPQDLSDLAVLSWVFRANERDRRLHRLPDATVGCEDAVDWLRSGGLDEVVIERSGGLIEGPVEEAACSPQECELHNADERETAARCVRRNIDAFLTNRGRCKGELCYVIPFCINLLIHDPLQKLNQINSL